LRITGLYLEILAKADAIVLDKTGTLTANKPAVVNVRTVDSHFSREEV
jgi:cation transport ATPase